MKIFILSILVVSFISLCFFKKRFWENRYLVLLLIGGVALVATLTTNLATRNKLGTRVKTIKKEDVRVFSVNQHMIDSAYFSTVDHDRFADHIEAVDSTAPTRFAHHMFYTNDDDDLCIGFATEDKLKAMQLHYTYIAPSESEGEAYYAKLRQYYNKRSDKWVANISLPFIKTITCLYLPPSEYATIPDSLIRELPF